mmetsp:Transcript_33117/g.48543  ORF Transcript_33117/g.48543 Transcript_33117/m.48543 type:complete len:90 (-) Transcript_33117:27-296(-)
MYVCYGDAIKSCMSPKTAFLNLSEFFSICVRKETWFLISTFCLKGNVGFSKAHSLFAMQTLIQHAICAPIITFSENIFILRLMLRSGKT